LATEGHWKDVNSGSRESGSCTPSRGSPARKGISKHGEKAADRCVTPSSSNVFAGIGVSEPNEELAKAQLATRTREIIRRRRLTQIAAAAVMGIGQPKVSALLSGRLAKFSSERLMRLLSRLGQDVEIVVKSSSRRGWGLDRRSGDCASG
jgi:predicted XRE-type DNA-binding protein